MLSVHGEMSIEEWIMPENITACQRVKPARCLKHVRFVPKVLRLVLSTFDGSQ